MHRSFAEDGLVLTVVRRCVPSARLGWTEKEIRRVKFNFTFENLEGQDEVSTEAPGFQ